MFAGVGAAKSKRPFQQAVNKPFVNIFIDGNDDRQKRGNNNAHTEAFDEMVLNRIAS